MQIEEVTRENVQALSISELKALRHRAVQLYDKTEAGKEAIRKRTVGVSQPVPADLFMDSYRLVVEELVKRGGVLDRTDLDAAAARRAMRGVDVSDLPTIVLREGAVCLTGQFVADPKHAGSVGVWLDSAGYPEELEKRMVEALCDQTGIGVAVVDELTDTTIPAYDLALVPRDTTVDISATMVEHLRKRREETDQEDTLDDADDVQISKPYPNEHASRQADPKQFTDMRRENDKFGAGIDVIWGVLPNGKVKVQAIRFDRKKYTPAQAKAWLEEHGYKTTLEVASNKSVLKVASEEERIVGGLVYAPDEVDAQGDFTDADEIWKGLKSHMIEGGGKMCVMHDGVAVPLPIVECFYAEAPTRKAGGTIPKGAWYLSVHVPDNQEAIWQAIKEERITGFSMGGTAGVVE